MNATDHGLSTGNTLREEKRRQAARSDALNAIIVLVITMVIIFTMTTTNYNCYYCVVFGFCPSITSCLRRVLWPPKWS